VRRVTSSHPGLRVYGGRLDRGLSSERALASTPGTFPDEERGLTDVQYIVPGAGGMGELLTNSWV
jgi:uracil phosphoribosyltransferase